MTFKTGPRWWISVSNSSTGQKHTTITFDLIAPYVVKFACSCGAQSDNLPSLRPENKCVVCGGTAFSNVHVLENFGLCLYHSHDFDAWLDNNRGIPVMDYLREKIQP